MTELEKEVADKNCAIEYITKKYAKQSTIPEDIRPMQQKL